MDACVIIPRLRWQLVVAGQPDLAQIPVVIVPQRGDRAIVVECCPRAAAAVQIGQTVWAARRQVDTLHVATVSPEQLAAAATAILAVLRQHADAVTRESLDTWTLPLVALGPEFRAAPGVAGQILRDLREATGLSAAIALSLETTVARLVARTLPPATTHVVMPGDEAAALAPLPARLLPGIGPRTEARLAQAGVHTIGELAALPDTQLRAIVGGRAPRLVALARGQISARRRPPRQIVQRRRDFADTPCADLGRLRAIVYLLAEQIGRDLRQRGVVAGRLTVQLSLDDGQTIQQTLTTPTRADLDSELADLANKALNPLSRDTPPVVAVTLSAGDLGPRPPALLADTERERRRQQAIDRIKDRYGDDAITSAALLPPRRRAA